MTEQELLVLFEATPQAKSEFAAGEVVNQLRNQLLKAEELLDDAWAESRATDEWKAYIKTHRELFEAAQKKEAIRIRLERAEEIRQAAYAKADRNFQEVVSRHETR